MGLTRDQRRNLIAAGMRPDELERAEAGMCVRSSLKAQNTAERWTQGRRCEERATRAGHRAFPKLAVHARASHRLCDRTHNEQDGGQLASRIGPQHGF